jgi:hypothetical protein
MPGLKGELETQSTIVDRLSTIVNRCAPTRTRTWNPLIKSQLLYQLSHGCENCARSPTDWASYSWEAATAVTAASSAAGSNHCAE